jgi:uncharacterized protein YceH (UPF0502 family)
VETAASAAGETGFARREGAEDEGHAERIAQLETTVAELRQEVLTLRKRIDDLFGDG